MSNYRFDIIGYHAGVEGPRCYSVNGKKSFFGETEGFFRGHLLDRIDVNVRLESAEEVKELIRFLQSAKYCYPPSHESH